MEYKSTFERIHNVRDIEYISKKICEDYGFEAFVGYNVISIGYEDFNYILETAGKKYVVKIFNKDRDEESCKRLIKILCKVISEGINHPHLYKNNMGEYIYNVTAQNVDLQLFVMEYIDGKNLYELNVELDESQLYKVAQTAAKINTIDFDIKETVYDEWTITNLVEEFEKKKEYVEPEDLQQIIQIVEEFKKIDLNLFPKCYVHADIIKANIIKDKNGELYYIDFSVFNYLPRIIECLVILLGDCLTDSKEYTISQMRTFIKAYNQYNPLDKKELDNVAFLLRVLAAMYVIQASYIKNYLHEDYVENEYWLSQGRKFLSMGINNNDLKDINADFKSIFSNSTNR